MPVGFITKTMKNMACVEFFSLYSRANEFFSTIYIYTIPIPKNKEAG
jgi:hypothetical protein